MKTSEEYWEKCWRSEDQKALHRYLSQYNGIQNAMITLFQESHVRTVCDAACGFGAYSLLLHSNGFIVSGFDVSSTSVELTKTLLSEYQIDPGRYIVSSITEINFENDSFDAAVAHAVLDHLTIADGKEALSELKRIVKEDGLIAISFDGYSKDDFETEHEILPDGCFRYTQGEMIGMLYHYYTDDEIKNYLTKETILHQEVKKNGERFIVLKNIGKK